MKSFFQGRTSVPLTSLRAPACQHARGSTAPTPGAPAAGEGPHVDVIKEGDKVVRIVVACGCGERIEIECLYPVGM